MTQHNPDIDYVELREMCAVDGDWGGTQWGDVILDLLNLREAQATPLTPAELRLVAHLDASLIPWLPEIQGVVENIMACRLAATDSRGLLASRNDGASQRTRPAERQAEAGW